jgi:hypothetical protein
MLAKIGNEDNMRALMEKGELYFAPLSYFKRVEKNKFRGDENEGLFRMSQADQVIIRIQMDGEDEVSQLDQSSGLIGQVKMAFPDVEEIGICSMAKVNLKGEYILFPEEMKSFGTHAVAIYNSRAFLDRVLEHSEKNSIGFESGNIEYIDGETYSGEMGIFRKLKDYEYQKEVRFVVHNKAAPFKMAIGSLKGIAQLIKVEDMQIMDL